MLAQQCSEDRLESPPGRVAPPDETRRGEGMTHQVEKAAVPIPVLKGGSP